MNPQEKLDAIEQILLDWDNESEEYTSECDVIDAIREALDNNQ